MKKTLFAVFVVVSMLMVSSAGVSAFDAKADSKANDAKIERKAGDAIAVKKAIFHGTGIHCDLCADSIEQAFAKTKGVECVRVDVKSKLATFCYLPEETDWKKIGTIMAEAGFQSDLVKVTDAECPCDKLGEYCKHWAKAKENEAGCKKKGCPFASQCKKVCK